MKIYFVCSPDRMVFAWGQTTRSYQERHRDGDWNKLRTYLRARGEDVILLAWYENVDIQDHDIHKHLKTVPGIPFPKRGEWSGYDSKIHTLESIQHLIEKKFFIESVKIDLELRPHQEKFVEKIISNWEQWKEFLCFVKCRGGKSIMTLSTIVEAGVKETLIVSRFNSPKQSWFDDCNKFGKFKNIRVVKLNEDNWVNDYKRWADDPDLQIIFWSTVQGLCVSGNKKLRKLVILSSIELIVFDECHIGEDADQFKKVRNKLPDAKCLKVSGTAYDQVWKYSKDNRFVHSYWDEQYYYPGKYPRMNVHTIKVDVSGYREIFGNDPDAFTNIFLTNDDETAFLYPDLVRNFWNKYFTVLGQRHLRSNERIIINRNHIIASLPSVAACRLSVPFISEYAALDVTSKTKEDSDSINKFVKEHSKTICLTVEANVLGVTCEEWDCVVHLYKGKDKKRWTQLSFRGGSGDHDWDVVDFAPRRALKSLQDSLTLAKVENPELLDYEITDFTNVFEWDDKFNQLSQDKVFDILSIDVKEDVQGSFRNLGRSISDERLNQEDFNTVDLASDKKPQSNIVNDNDTNDESAKKLVEGFGEKKLTKKENTVNRRKLEQILNSIPLVLAHASKSGNPIRTTDELFTSEFYEPITQDTESVIYNLLQTRDMSARDITTIIHQNNPIIDKSVRNDFTKTLDSFRITKQTQQVIPLDLLKKLLPKVDDDNYVLIVGDPSGSCCSYVIEHLGVPPSNVWVWEDHSTHKFLIQSISSEINLLKNIEDYRMDRSKTYCIGNPPYSNTSAITTHNSNLDSEFYLKCMERGSYVKEIIRSKHFVTKNCLFRKKLFGSGHMKSIVYLPDTTFPTVSGTEFCIAEWDEDHTGLTSITYDNGTVLHQQLNENSLVKLNNPDFDKEVKNNLADRWIRGKLNLKEIVDGDSPMVKELGKGKTPVVVNVPSGLEETARNRHGVVMANVNGNTASKGLIKVMVKPYEASIAAGIICLLTNSEEESEILRDYLLSEEVTETIKKCVPTRTRSHLLFSKIKDPLV